MKIAVLEDNPAIACLLLETLERRGHFPSVYRDGWKFLEQIISEDLPPSLKPFDVVLIDLLLPSGISGFQALQQVRMSFPDLPIVVISSASNEHLEALKRDYPGVKTFRKPFKLQDLLTAIETI